jgi:hypothetical protein
MEALSDAEIAKLVTRATEIVRVLPAQTGRLSPSPMAEGPVMAAVFGVLVEQEREAIAERDRS